MDTGRASTRFQGSSMKVQWIGNDNADAISRSRVNPYARDGYKPVNLAWLRKHAEGVYFQARWWDGPDGHTGKWHTQDIPISNGKAPSLKDLRTFAAMLAATVTLWEVEIEMRARTHGHLGWEYGSLVWTFGHAQRDTDEARRLRDVQ